MTTYAANTTYQIITHNDYQFLVKRIAWKSKNFPTTYTYRVSEPTCMNLSESKYAYHQTVHHDLGQWWGDVTTYFDSRPFSDLPHAGIERGKNIRIYQAFRDSIAAAIEVEAINRGDWNPLPLD